MMINKKAIITLVTCLVASMPTGCAIQKDIATLQEQMIVTERRNEELQRRNTALEKQLQDEVANLGKSSQSAEKNLRTQYASVNVNLDTLQQELRLLSGRLEEMEYLLNRKFADADAGMRKRQERLDEIGVSMAETEQRLAALERYLSLGSKAQPAGADQNAAPAPVQNLYDTAKAAYDKGEWEKARRLFTQLIDEQPKSENADNAQFWIGETYYNEQWFEKAILEYQTVIEKYPQGNKVPAAMLKQGLSFLKLGDQSNARLVLQRLTQKYPKTNESSVASARLKDI